MSVTYTYVIPGVDASQLHQELIRASLIPELVQFEVVTVPDPSPPGPPLGAVDTYEDTVYLTFPDGTVEADVDTVVAAHVPKVRYDTTTRKAQLAAMRESTRLRAEYVRLQDEVDDVLEFTGLRVWLTHLLEVLARRDRTSGLY
jgi:hypothetical protein